jgi:predicted dehydrogenase
MNGRVLKVALVGCGQIADAHLQEIRKISCVRAVAVCDSYPDLARQAATRFEVPGVFDDLGRMLAETLPDVLHVTTPPHTHAAIARQALAAGVHVYVEKPFTVDAVEADQLLSAARAHDRLVCVGHDQLFDPIWEDCRRLVQCGELGRIVHVDSVQGYNLDGPFGKVLSSEGDHWVFRLPGGLFQNTMSHALYRLTDLMPDEELRVWATQSGGPAHTRFPTELRVLLRGEETTGTLLFTSAARPVQRLARVYGTKGSAEIDVDGRVLRRARAAALPGAFAKIEVPFRHLCEAGRLLARNAWKFFRSDIHYFAGMNRLFTLFYQAILEGGPPPIPYSEIYRVTALMDEIFERSQVEGSDERDFSCRNGAHVPATQVN